MQDDVNLHILHFFAWRGPYINWSGDNQIAVLVLDLQLYKAYELQWVLFALRLLLIASDRKKEKQVYKA